MSPLSLVAHGPALEVLASAGFNSSLAVADQTERQFAAALADALGGEAVARSIHRRAIDVRRRIELLVANLAAAGGAHAQASLFHNAAPDLAGGLPHLDELFPAGTGGSCSGCGSVLGPAAYLADLIGLVEDYISESDDQRTLRARRPDLWGLPLDDDSGPEVPVLEIAVELMRATVGGQRQRSSEAVLGEATFPIALPWYRPLEELRASLRVLGHDLAGVWRLLRVPEDRLVLERLGLSVEQARLVTERRTTAAQVANVYGVDAAALDGLASIDRLLVATGLTSGDLTALLARAPGRALFLDRGRDFDHRLGVVVAGGEPARIEHLDVAALDRLHRVVRLARALGWSFAELDRVLASLAVDELDADCLRQLAAVRDLAARTGQPPSRLASIWQSDEGTGLDRNPPTRLAQLGLSLGVPVRDLVALRTVLGTGDMALTPVAIAELVRWSDWLVVNGLTVDQLARVCQPVTPPAITAADAAFLETMARAAPAWMVGPAAFIGDHVDAAVSAELHRELIAAGVLDVRGRVVPSSLAVDPAGLGGVARRLTDPRAARAPVSAGLAAVLGSPTALASIQQVLERYTAVQQRGVTDQLAGYLAAEPAMVAVVAATVAGAAATDPAGLLLSFLARCDAAPFARDLMGSSPVLSEGLARELNSRGVAIPAGSTLQGIAEGVWLAGADTGTVALVLDRGGLSVYAGRADRGAELSAFFDGVRRGIAATALIGFDVAATVRLLAFPEAHGIITPAATFALAPEVVRRLRALAVEMSSADEWAAAIAACLAATDFFPRAAALLAAATGLQPTEVDALISCGVIDLATMSRVDVILALRGLETLARDSQLEIEELGWIRDLHAVGVEQHSRWADVSGSVVGRSERRLGDRWTGYGRERDDMLGAERDALVAYLTAGAGRDAVAAVNVRELGDHYLVDLEMSACARSTRLREGVFTVQRYIDRVRMGLEPATSHIPDRWWAWMDHFREWQANRKVFLYPESYLDPTVRSAATPLFAACRDELLQGELTSERVERAYTHYLDALLELTALDIVAACHVAPAASAPEPIDPALILVGRTRGNPGVLYQRSATLGAGGRGIVAWSPWVKIDLTISANQVTAVHAFGRLCLFWVERSERTVQSPRNDGSGETDRLPAALATIRYSCQRAAGGWMPPQTLCKDVVINIDLGKFAADGVRGLRTSLAIVAGGTRHIDLRLERDAWQRVSAVKHVAADGSERLLVLYGDLIDPLRTAPDSSQEWRRRDLLELVSVAAHRAADIGHFAAQASPGIADHMHSLVLQCSAVEAAAFVNELMGPLRETIRDSAGAKFSDASVDLFVKDTRHTIDEISKSAPDWTPEAAKVGPLLLDPLPRATCAEQEAFFTMLRDAALAANNPGIARVTIAPAFRIDGDLIAEQVRLVVQPSRGSEPRIAVGPLGIAVAASDNPIGDDHLSIPASAAAPTLLRDSVQRSRARTVTDRGGWSVVVAGGEPFLLLPDVDTPPTGQRITVDETTTGVLVVGMAAADASASQPPTYRAVRLATRVVQPLAQRMLAGGVDRLLAPGSQLLPELPFARLAPVGVIEPEVSRVDFRGPWSAYLWEVFFHLPFLIGWSLGASQCFADARRWYEYVFTPTPPPPAADDPPIAADGAPADRFWRFLPFRGRGLASLEADLSDAAQLRAYDDDPYDPDAVARLRLGAYEKALVMAYIDNLLRWGDSLFAEGTWESLGRADLLYGVARQLLGPRPPAAPVPADPPPPRTYATLRAADRPSMTPALLALEERLAASDGVVVLSDGPFDAIDGTCFCVPESPNFIACWDRVDDRLFKLHNCLDLAGNARQPSAFAAPIDPRSAGRSDARDVTRFGAGIGTPVPHYRFAYLIDRARAMTAEVAQFGAALGVALEKQDAEELIRLRAAQERAVLALTTSARERQIDELSATVDSLQAALESADARRVRYQAWLTGGLSAEEKAADKLAISAMALQSVAAYQKFGSVGGYLLPNIFGLADGGVQLGAAVGAEADGFDAIAGVLTSGGQLASTRAGFARRRDEWQLQAELAAADAAQLTAQRRASEARLESARRELDAHLRSVEQAAAVETLLTRRFTNRELYLWMAGRLASVYFQAYQIAFDLALACERAFQFELDSDDTMIDHTAWDSLQRGLLAGESLQLALARLERAYLGRHVRELEIEKTISLRQHDPAALLALLAEGACEFDLDAASFEHDFPGHYLRRVKSVAITIPAVLGPYQTVHATLAQLTNRVVLRPDIGAVRFLVSAGQPEPDPRSLRSNWRPDQRIAISRAVEDHGLFALDVRDERYLPFEGTGAIPRWRLELPRATNQFDLDSVTDVVVHLRYTARAGDEAYRRSVAALPSLQTWSGTRVVSLSQEASTEWSGFLHPLDGQPPTLTITVSSAMFPTNLRRGSLAIGQVTCAWIVRSAARGVTMPTVDVSGVPTGAGGATVPPAPGSPWRLTITTAGPVDADSVLDLWLLLPYTGQLA